MLTRDAQRVRLARFVRKHRGAFAVDAAARLDQMCGESLPDVFGVTEIQIASVGAADGIHARDRRRQRDTNDVECVGGLPGSD